MSEDLTKLPPELVAAKTKALEAEAAKLEAETRSELARARRNEYEAEVSSFGLEREREKRARILQSDTYRRFYRFDEPVSAASAGACIDQIAEWARVARAEGDMDPHIKIQFNSPGGSVFEGLALFDEIQHWRRNGVRFTTSTIGMAASMAGILLQAGDKRVMAPESWMLIHKTSFGAIGNFDEVQDRVKMLDRVQARIVDIFVTRANEAKANGTCEKPITKGQLERRWDRKDWWISSDEALKFGLVDAVR